MAARHGDDFYRQRESAQGIHQLGLIANADKLPGNRSDNFFSGEGAAAALYQLQAAIAFIGAVHIDIHAIHAIQVVNRDAVLTKPVRACFRAGHSHIDFSLDSAQRVDKVIGCGARADADDAVSFELRSNIVDGCLGDSLLHFVLGHIAISISGLRHYRRRRKSLDSLTAEKILRVD